MCAATTATRWAVAKRRRDGATPADDRRERETMIVRPGTYAIRDDPRGPGSAYFRPVRLRPGYLSGQNGDYPNDWHCRVLTKSADISAR